VCQPEAYSRKDTPLLKLIVQHSPKLLAFLCGLQLRLTKPQLQHVLCIADALLVSEARHKTIAGSLNFSQFVEGQNGPST
jgi:hypothetical protein